MYVLLWNVRVTTVAEKSNTYYVLHIPRVCVCSLRWPACKAHVPYFHLWPDRLYNIFPHYLINGTIFEKKLFNLKYVFRISLPTSLKQF
jgi:hypothetical protein